VNYGVGIVDPPPEHFFNRTVINSEARLVLSEAALLLNLDLDGFTERPEFTRDAAEENGGT